MEASFYKLTQNPSVVSLSKIPVLDYDQFTIAVNEFMQSGTAHCLSYFAIPVRQEFHFFCFIAEDSKNEIYLLSHKYPAVDGEPLPAITGRIFSFHAFEREIHENLGIRFIDHPWLKPVRFAGPADLMEKYPFYSIDGDELHEVGVGPIHAGVIEPGHFRFICKGEKVLHLEIQLGYQHRGIENLFVQDVSGLRRMVLSESIAGDTAIGHSLCHVQLIEALAGITPSPELERERIIALELERIAMHIGDTAALCADIAYQLGQVVNEALRTIVINTTQQWCGNRFGKGLIRTGGSHYPLTSDMVKIILSNLEDVEKRYFTMSSHLFSMSSVLNRFESTGRLTRDQVALIGAVGMAARSTGLKRDIRSSHPFQAYKDLAYEAVILEEGDVWARAYLRAEEIRTSLRTIRDLLKGYKGRVHAELPVIDPVLPQSSLAISITEGWRGEIVHAAVTADNGQMVAYKIKDPSFHNWMALALAVRNQEISDFPVCNKSFNLSYCGHDL